MQELNLHKPNPKPKTQTKQPRVVGVGNALIDIIYNVDSDSDLIDLNLPKGSMSLVDAERASKVLEFCSCNNCHLATGGAASNTINALSVLGIPTAFVGCVGEDDEYGKFYKKDLEKNGVLPYLKQIKAPSGTAITLMSPDSERTFATFLGASLSLDADFLRPEFFESCDFCHIEGFLVQDCDLMEKAMSMAKEAGVKVSCDLASYNVVEENKAFLERVIPKYVDVLFVNEEEAIAFTGHSDIEAANYIGDLCEYAVVKMGKRGSLIKHNGEIFVIEPYLAQRVDTNGAGDAYAAGVLYGLTRGLPLHKTGEIASLISAKVVEVVGPKLNEKAWQSIMGEIERIAGL